MLNKTYFLSDETFHQTFFSNYILQTYISKYQLWIIVLDKVRKKFIYFCNYFFEEELNSQLLSNLLRKQNVSNHFYKINVVLYNNEYITIPETFFQNDKKALLLKFTHGTDFKNIVAKNGEFSTTSIFNIPDSVKEAFQLFEKVDYYHHVHLLLQHAQWSIIKFKWKYPIFVYFEKQSIQVAAFENNNLLIVNTYEVQNDDDVLYFLNFLIKNLSIKISDAIFVLLGYIDKKSEIIKKFKSFDMKFEWGRFNSRYIYSYRYNELPAHQFASCLNVMYENY